MKLTPSQLKKIIAEEVQKALLSENPHAFYAAKADKLAAVLRLLDAGLEALREVSDLEERSTEGEDVDVRSAIDDLTSLRAFVEGIHSAVFAMV